MNGMMYACSPPAIGPDVEKAYRVLGRRAVVTETSSSDIRRESRSRNAALKKQRSLSSSLSPRIIRRHRKQGHAPLSPLSPPLPRQRPHSHTPQTIWYTSSNLDEFAYAGPRAPSPSLEHMFPRKNSCSPTHIKTKLHHFSPREVAQELCLMDSELIRKISPRELEGGKWMKDQKAVLAPNVLAMVKASNQIAQLIPSEVLAETTPQARARVISIFIKVASKCYHLRNFNSLKAVLAGLQCTPVFRLKRTWKEVPAKKKKKYAALTKLMSEDHNWSQYRMELQSKLDSNIPCIPFLGVLLTSIVQQGSAHTVKYRGRRYSGVEDYTIMEAITVRNRLEKIRKYSSSNRYSVFNPDSIPSPTSAVPKRSHTKSLCDQSDGFMITRQDRFDMPETHHSILEEEGGSDEEEENEGDPPPSPHPPSCVAPKSAAELQHKLTLSEIDFNLVESVEPSANGWPDSSEGGVVLSEGNVALQSLTNHRPVNIEVGGGGEDLGTRQDDGSIGESAETGSPVGESKDQHFLPAISPVGRRRGGDSIACSTDGEPGEGSSQDSPTEKSGTLRRRNVPSVTIDVPENRRESDTGSHFDVYWDPGRSLSLPSSNAELSGSHVDGNSGAMLRTPRAFKRSISEQEVSLTPPTLGSFLSMECLADLLENPQMVANLSWRGSAHSLYRNSTISSLSSDEGFGPSDTDADGASSVTMSPELPTSPLAGPAHYRTRESSSGGEDRNLSGTEVGGVLQTERTSAVEADSEGEDFLNLPRITQHVCDDSTRKVSNESIAAEEPERRRSRRRASKVLLFALATSDKTMHVPSLLERYQVCSLACCMELTCSQLLREIITNTPRNTEAQNYKLSYEREPQ